MEAVLNGPNGRTVLGPTPLSIGRTPDNQLVVNDIKASSHHAEIRPDGQSYSIIDLGSTNGTFLNGQRLEPRMPRQLNPGDTIRIGDTPYTYQASGASGTQYASTVFAGSGQGSGPGQSNAPSAYDPTIASSSSPSGFDPTIAASSSPSPSTAYGANAMQGYQSSSPDYQQYNQGAQAPYQESQSAYPPPSPNPAYGQSSYTPPPPPAYPAYNQPNSMAYPPPPPVNQMNQANLTPGAGLPSYGGVPPQAPQKPKRRSTGMIVAIVAIVLLLILGSVGFLVVHNNQVATDNSNATATANAHVTATQQAIVSATGRANATASAVANAKATATATVVAGNPNPYPPNTGTLALYDPLTSNNQGYKWDEGSGCAFTNNSYHVSEATTGKFLYCSAGTSNFSNFAYRVEMTITRGDCGGMIFRANTSNNSFYDFEVCQDGSYYLALYANGSGKYIMQPKNSSAIKTGLNQDNIVAIVAQGKSLTMYVNNQNLGTANDASLSSGSVGVIADAVNVSTDVGYVFAKVWTL